uniref:Uncharacterized protein n=1 Tax=Meloidogyne incognita TaxID=6306 RepID=A0A914MD35_MELIC
MKLYYVLIKCVKLAFNVYDKIEIGKFTFHSTMECDTISTIGIANTESSAPPTTETTRLIHVFNRRYHLLLLMKQLMTNLLAWAFRCLMVRLLWLLSNYHNAMTLPHNSQLCDL